MASDVAVGRFCTSRCGTHGSSLSPNNTPPKGKIYKFAYIWVGNSEKQCPDQCAWPFHQPIYGPQGLADAPLEAASACPGVYGSGAYPGYAGNLLVDTTTGASYNAHGANGRKFLLPALFNPSTSSCSTLV
ncbi:hypothetical protein KY285_021206 [Solanum tuberosum]|nr:hypothetical protein KY284_021265 [Solanum tuberosum]KAH0694109.1 hypothetical protein KY285_021206 [Solanum tuberosum]